MTATITPPERGMARKACLTIDGDTALALAKLVSPDWLALGVHIAEHRDYSVTVDGDPDPAVTIVVTVGVPTDGPKFQRGRGYALAQAIGVVRPVVDGGANG